MSSENQKMRWHEVISGGIKRVAEWEDSNRLDLLLPLNKDTFPILLVPLSIGCLQQGSAFCLSVTMTTRHSRSKSSQQSSDPKEDKPKLCLFPQIPANSNSYLCLLAISGGSLDRDHQHQKAIPMQSQVVQCWDLCCHLARVEFPDTGLHDEVLIRPQTLLFPEKNVPKTEELVTWEEFPFTVADRYFVSVTHTCKSETGAAFTVVAVVDFMLIQCH
ncbi:hypothetical protein WISP_63388 [Willisornis vidua]|uniref:Uncharacterized protein n=1 Tax=Willisornis vidua TaxID=1566151 RepID=A0ABQ9DAG0_9PASS|nr:hypothetical protein WISP_63388 [Willisornis vidua]